MASCTRPSGSGGRTLFPPMAGFSRPLTESAVTNQFSREPQARLPRQQSVVRVARFDILARLRRLAVGRRGHDQPMHLLHVPAGLDELRSQPIEQFGDASAARPACQSPPRFHQTAAKELLPHAVHGHARRERILSRDEPPRQASRDGLELLGSGGRMAGVCGWTSMPGCRKSPRIRMRVWGAQDSRRSSALRSAPDTPGPDRSASGATRRTSTRRISLSVRLSRYHSRK